MNQATEWTQEEKIWTHIEVCGKKLVHQRLIRSCDREDFQHDFWLHLLKIARKYDPSRGQPITFVSTVLSNFTSSYLQAQFAQKRRPREKLLAPGDICRHPRTDEMVDVESLMDQSALERRTGVVSHDQLHQVEQRDLYEYIKSALEPDELDLMLQIKRSNVTQTARWRGKSRDSIRKERDRIRWKIMKAGKS